jgi:hypothetical protein
MALLWAGPLDKGVQAAMTIGIQALVLCAGNIHTARRNMHPVIGGRHTRPAKAVAQTPIY